MITNKKSIALAVCAFLFALGSSATAQPPARLRRIGYLAASRGPSPFFEAFK